jgi:hypothetical protein
MIKEGELRLTRGGRLVTISDWKVVLFAAIAGIIIVSFFVGVVTLVSYI